MAVIGPALLGHEAANRLSEVELGDVAGLLVGDAETGFQVEGISGVVDHEVEVGVEPEMGCDLGEEALHHGFGAVRGRGAPRRPPRAAVAARPAGAQRLHAAAEFVLPAAGAESRPQAADEGGEPDGAFEHGDVAEQVHRPGGHWRVGPAAGEQQDRHVGPRGLLTEHFHEAVRLAVGEDFLGQ